MAEEKKRRTVTVTDPEDGQTHEFSMDPEEHNLVEQFKASRMSPQAQIYLDRAHAEFRKAQKRRREEY